jgi:hypothetical protein
MPLNPDAARYSPPDPDASFATRQFNVTCLSCPLQIEGHVDGFRFYFRARHNRWRLEIDESGGGVVIAHGDTDDFTEGQAVDLICLEMGRWLWIP